MYIKEPKEDQYSFQNDWFMVPDVYDNHILIKIAHHIDWVRLTEKLTKFYCLNNGRPTKPSRAKVGLLIIKHLYQLSDRNVVDLLRRDIYVQYLCNISPKESKQFIDPSTLTKFRNQIGAEGIKIIEAEIYKTIQKVKPPRGRRLVTDTTVIPSNIAYPTDVNLLDKVRCKAVEFLDKAKELTAKRYRTYKRVAKRIVIQYQKVRKHTKQSRRKVQKKLIQFCSRNIGQLKEALHQIKGSLKDNDQAMLKEIEDFLQKSTTIVNQQKDVYQEKEVKERIVSFHRMDIRPMVRGKYPVNVEFGPKVLLNLDDDYLYLEDLYFNNVSDTQLLTAAIDGYQTRRGSPPTPDFDTSLF